MIHAVNIVLQMMENAESGLNGAVLLLSRKFRTALGYAVTEEDVQKTDGYSAAFL